MKIIELGSLYADTKDVSPFLPVFDGVYQDNDVSKPLFRASSATF